MILRKLSILNYKNIREATTLLSPKMNCFIGHNGAGKTNFLDAVYYLSFCRSASNPIDSQLITHGQDFFMLDGLYDDDGHGETSVYCGMKKGTKKHFKRDKKEYKRLSQHLGLIPLIIVSPADTSIVDGSSEERRKFMDVAIAQYDRTYIDALANYNKALQQRNVMLKAEEEPDTTLLELWEDCMAKEGTVIFRKREQFIQELIPIFQHIYRRISGNKEEVSLNYISHGQRGELLDVIRRDRFKDRAVGYSLHGIHRDDLEMLIDGFQMRREGSQGQLKTYVLALKLAQFDFLRRTVSHTTPLLLLDDIFDKLDADRVEQIVKLVSNDNYGQIFITDTNREHLDKILKNNSFDYKIFIVNDGEIKEKAHV
ncbi:MAG: DNA replication/repair protein RecF [Prevotella sp.]